MGPTNTGYSIHYAIAFFGAIASIIDAIFGKEKIYKLFVDFCFA